MYDIACLSFAISLGFYRARPYTSNVRITQTSNPKRQTEGVQGGNAGNFNFSRFSGFRVFAKSAGGPGFFRARIGNRPLYRRADKETQRGAFVIGYNKNVNSSHGRFEADFGRGCLPLMCEAMGAVVLCGFIVIIQIGSIVYVYENCIFLIVFDIYFEWVTHFVS